MAWIVSRAEPLWAVFVKRWAVCFITAVGIAWACVSSVHVAAAVAGYVGRLFGIEGVDGAVRSII